MRKVRRNIMISQKGWEDLNYLKDILHVSSKSQAIEKAIKKLIKI